VLVLSAVGLYLGFEGRHFRILSIPFVCSFAGSFALPVRRTEPHDLAVKLWTWKKENLPTLKHALRTTVAAALSTLLARLVGMPEYYWATITTLLIMQSSLTSTVPLAVEQIAASAFAAVLGAIEATYFGRNLIVFGLAIFLLGVISRALRVEKSGYRYASVTLAIVVLIPRAYSPWIIATHRFIEVSLGILTALAVAGVWPEEEADRRDARRRTAPQQ
jgi:uncharacterized membrane protein YgaE (UPF0421/DUF939 family)